MTTAQLGRRISDIRLAPLLHRAATIAVLLAAVGLLQAVVVPFAGELGPVRYTLTKSKPPLRLLTIFLLVSLLLHSGFRTGAVRALRELAARSRRWPIGWTLTAAVLSVHFVVAIWTLAPLPDEIRRSLRAKPGNYGNVFSTYHFSEEFASSFAACFENLPPDARVLYRGGHEATRIAYLAFPRRIFMLPQDRYFATIEVQDCYDVHQRRPDPLFPRCYPPPEKEVDVDDFCRDRRLTHEIRLVDGRWESKPLKWNP